MNHHSKIDQRSSDGDETRKASDYDDEYYPFRNECYKHLTLSDKIQIAVMSITVAPIRLVFVGISLLLLWPFAFITTRGITEQNRHEPLTGWRKNLVPLMRVLSRAVFFWAGFHRIRIIGEQHLDTNTPIVVVAPHTGFMDALFFVHANFLSGVARAGTEQVLIFGRVVKVFKCIIVNRDKSASRSDTVQRLIDRVERAEQAKRAAESTNSSHAAQWPIIGLFPQGTCSNQRSIVRFKSGAFIPGRTVQPVCIRYPSLKFDSITWTWEGPSVFALAWLTLCQYHIPVEFHILPPYQPSDEEKRNADLYAENVRRLMAAYLDVPRSDLSYEDGRLMSKMDKFGLPNKCGTIRVHNVKKKFCVNDDDIDSLLPLFAPFANKSTGLCHIEKFADNLGLKLTQPIEKLFKEFDLKNSGSFKFREFVETYFGKIRPTLNEIDIESFIKSFDKFRESENEYTLDELNSESKRRFGIEFVEKNVFQLDRIGKDNLKSFLLANKLHLYLFIKSNNAS